MVVPQFSVSSEMDPGGGGGDDKTGSMRSTGGNDDNDNSNKTGSFLTVGYALLILS